jgi:hypothetical protein
MPSEEREEQVFQALERATQAFRSALATTIEEVRGLAAAAADAGGRAEADGAELGSFAAGRIDTDRFSVLAGAAPTLDAAVTTRVKTAFEVLTSLASRKTGLFRAGVEPSGSLRHAVAGALAEAGRAFGAARVVELARSGRYVESQHAAWLQAWPFSRWNRQERRLAPPQVVHVDGGDLHAEGLAEFLDGSEKLVLIVRGECPPAPLARLVSPGVYVLQTLETKDLEAFAAFDGPGVAALVTEGAARFVHDPSRGESLRERLEIRHLPTEEPRRQLGGLSAAQLSRQLRHLQMLDALARGEGAPVPGAPVTPAAGDPADVLAAWLLSQADLEGKS